jgi:uncharacterized protein (TIGR01619 family)
VSNNWDSYLCNVNDQLASIRVDLGIRPEIPDRERSWLLWVWVYFKQPRPDGLSSSEEFDKLSSLEDALRIAIEQKSGGLLSGCITTSGRREFYFYAPNPDRFEETVRATVSLAHDYKFDCDTQEDPGWSQYLNVLYPSEEQRELIENRRLMDLMRGKGDRLEGIRDVSHWARFLNRSDRMVFIDAVRAIGYRIEREYENSDGECRYGVCISRSQDMGARSVDDAVIQLFRASKSANGEYDGWECQLMSEQSDGKS